VIARRAWTSVVLVALAIGATAYAYVADRGAISDADREGRDHDVFPSFRVADVRRVELGRNDGDVRLDRATEGGDGWTVSAPHLAAQRADPGAVDALLREFEVAKRIREVPDGEAHGLEAPRVKGKLRVGRIEYEFALGDDALRPEGGAYMRLDGEGAFVVDRGLKAQLLRGADAYRDRAVVPYGAADVARLEVTSPKARFALERVGTTFRVDGARGLRAARAEVDRVFGALADARADAFLDDTVAAAALSGPSWSVRITPRDARLPALDVQLGGSCPGRSGVVAVARQTGERVSACVPASVASALDADPAALVDRSLFYAHPDEIEELRVEAPGGAAVDLARRGSGWRERSPDVGDLDAERSEAANDLAFDVAAARATEARLAAGRDRVAAHARVSVTRTGGGTAERIEIDAPRADGSALARRIDDGAVLTLAPDVVRRIEARPFVVRPRAIWPAPFDAAAVASIDTTCGPAPQRLELHDGRWQLRAPRGFNADPAAADALASALANAKANRWIAESDDGSFGLDAAHACSVTATLVALPPDRAPRSVGILFGREADGGVYARTLDAPGVFVAAETLRAAVARPAIDRGRLRVDPLKVTRVTLVRGTAKVTLEKQGSRWVRADGDAGADERLGDDVFELVAEEALHPGPPARSEGFARPTLEIEALGGGEGSAPSMTNIVVGAPTRVGTSDAYFARVSGVDATFAVARPGIDAILGAW
jgi:hypothetical protein